MGYCWSTSRIRQRVNELTASLTVTWTRFSQPLNQQSFPVPLELEQTPLPFCKMLIYTALGQFAMSNGSSSLVTDISCSFITYMKTKYEAHDTVGLAADVGDGEEKHQLT